MITAEDTPTIADNSEVLTPECVVLWLREAYDLAAALVDAGTALAAVGTNAGVEIRKLSAECFVTSNGPGKVIIHRPCLRR